MLSKLPRRAASCYEVGWLCALPYTELPAAILMLDHEHEPAHTENRGDENVYHYGDLNGHNVVVASMAPGRPGNTSSQRLVYPLRQSFPNMKLHLFVGIGGGVPRRPRPDDPYMDIHLGDVAISWAEKTNVPGIVHYERVETLPNGQSGPVGSLDKTSRQLLNALGGILNDKRLNRNRFHEHLARFADHPDFKHPGLDKDVLFEASYHHGNENNPSDCSECDRDQRVMRKPRPTDKMVFHEGTILSGEQVMKDPVRRDALSQKYHDAICFEMEAAGIMEDTHCLVVRGISDYCDSHKNGSWQPYAAAAAAAFAREILCQITPHNGPRSPSPYSGSHPQQVPDSDSEGQIGGGSTRGLLENAGNSQSDATYRLAERMYSEEVPSPLAHAHYSRTLRSFQRAEKTLMESGYKDPEARRSVFLRMAQLETKMTYHEREREMKERHMDNAETYIEEATLAAEMTENHRHIARTKFEQACMKGRRLKLKKKRGLDMIHRATEASTIYKEITSEGQKLQELDNNTWIALSGHADWWLRRLEPLK
ncbi:hypothetical protein G7Y79_00006g018440 [Physcia stellaris]|nr:hypothetical protein G7Y79_00006g018440 [Physcia stellaris]